MAKDINAPLVTLLRNLEASNPSLYLEAREVIAHCWYDHGTLAESADEYTPDELEEWHVNTFHVEER